MFPTLVDFGFLKIHSYGFLMVVGFLLGVYFVRKKCRKEGIDVHKMTDTLFWAFLISIIGGRVLFIITTYDHYLEHPGEIFMFWKGGLVFYGGFLAGILGIIFLTKHYRIPTLKTFDIIAPSIALGHMVGRLGCFAAGCCFGRPVTPDFVLKVIFSHPESVAPRGIPLHPAQLYDALNNLIIFLILQYAYKKKKFDGQIILMYAMLYAVGRSIVEIYRGDKVRGFVIGDVLSTSQFIALLVILIGSAIYWKLRKSSAKLA